MNRLSLFFAALAVMALSLFSTCNKDDDNGNCSTNFNYTTEVQAEATAFSNAAGVYSSNPTTENCQAYIAAGQVYIDALDDINVCVPTANQAAYQQSIDAARASLNATQC